jgi:hypothetical protein
MRLIATQSLRAPIGRAFDAFTDMEHAAGRVKGIKKVEIRSEARSGLGLRWGETRDFFGDDATVEKAIVAFEPGRSFRVESTNEGMHSVSVFEFAETAAGCEVTWTHDLTPLTFKAKLMSPMLWLMKGTVLKYMKDDLADLTAFLEAAP